jgi:O-antigen/teichoic acid export membrane protein
MGKPANPPLAASTGHLEQVVRYSSQVFIANLVFFLVYRIDYWFVKTYCSAEELGNYIQVSRIVQWLLLIPMMISTVIFPLTASGRDANMSGKIILLSRVLLWVYLGGCMLVALTGYWVFPWLFGGTFSLMYPVFLLYIPGVLALASLYPVSSYNAGIKRVDINLQGSMLALAVIVTLNLIFTPVYGIYAAAVASSLGYLVYFGFSFYKFNRANKLSLYKIFKPAAGDYTMLRSALYRRK